MKEIQKGGLTAATCDDDDDDGEMLFHESCVTGSIFSWPVVVTLVPFCCSFS